MSRAGSDHWRGRKVLVTGGLGFIGSNIAIRLVELGARVAVVDSLHPGCGGNEFNVEPVRGDIEIHRADVRTADLIEDLVQDRDVIFNMVGHVSHIDSMADPYTDLEINCTSHLAVLEACRKVNRNAVIVYAGTRGQYGRPERLPVDEAHPLRPTDINGANKTAAERYHLIYHHVHGIRSFSLRLTNIYGPRHQMRNSRQGIINWFIRLALEDGVIPIYGDGRQIRDCNFVEDVVEAMLMGVESGRAEGQVFNLGGDEPRSLLELAEAIVKIAGRGRIEMAEFPASHKAIEIGSYHADSSRFRQATGWKPGVSLEDGLARTIEFYRIHQDRYF